jgi:hypothetical protein
MRAFPLALGVAIALRHLRLDNNRLTLSIAAVDATLGRMLHLTKLVWGPDIGASDVEGGLEAVESYLASQLASVEVERLAWSDQDSDSDDNPPSLEDLTGSAAAARSSSNSRSSHVGSCAVRPACTATDEDCTCSMYLISLINQMFPVVYT